MPGTAMSTERKQQDEKDKAEMGLLLQCGWQHIGNDQWLPPDSDIPRSRDAAFKRVRPIFIVTPTGRIN